VSVTFCLAEDRIAEEVGLRLALVSLRRHCPGAPVVVHRANPSADFTAWLRDFPSVTLIPAAPPGASSWNCKPHAMLPLLAEGRPEVVWLDSDIVLSRDPLYLFRGRPPEALLLAQEQCSSAHQGTAHRTTGWGLPVGRAFPRTLNTCVLRVTAHHLPLLRRWQEMLADERYVQFQQRPLQERPVHFMSDQDALNALVGAQECSSIPVVFLPTGRDVIHSGGALAYSLGERLAGLFRRIPPLVHGQGAKPWMMFDPAANLGGWFWFYRRLLMEVSPYLALARRHRAELGVPCPWLDYRSPLGLLCRMLGFGHFALRGLPLTAAATLLRGGRPEP
jgi:hypothetical protein